MAKLLKSALALGLAALLLFACAACGDTSSGKDPTTDAPETEVTTTEPESLDVAATTGEDGTSEEPTTVDGTTAEAASTVPGETTVEGETTTVIPTTVPGKPSTKAEIVAYVNGMMTKVRAEKPGYSMQEITHIDGDGITSSKSGIKTLAKGVVAISKGFWSKWSDPKAKGEGEDHGGVNPKTDLQESWVKSASCNESGSNYVIRVNIIDERVTKLPDNEKDTMHGKIMMAQTKGGIEDGAAQVGLKFSKVELLYTGSYIEMTVNRATGLPTKITAYTNYKMDMVADLFGGIDAVIPLANEKVFTF